MRSFARIGVFVLISPRPLVTLTVWSPLRLSRTTPGAPAATRASASFWSDACASVRFGVAAAAVTTRTAAIRHARIPPLAAVVLRRRGLAALGWVVLVMVFLRLVG